jgi:hypothetical protein
MSFTYVPRSSRQLLGRMSQLPDTDFITPVAVTVPVDAEHDEDRPILKRKLGVRTLCVDCGHEQRDHHLHSESHLADGAWPYYCVTAHCVARFWRGSETEQCSCQHFRATPEVGPQFTRPAVEDWTLCVSCNHPRLWHCTKRILAPGRPLSHLDWKGLEIDGQPEPCSHTPEAPVPYACDSSHCAQILGEGEAAHYCECRKFHSPFLKRKAAKRSEVKTMTLFSREALRQAEAQYRQEQQQATQSAPKAKDRKAEILIEVVREDPSLTVAQLAEAAGRSQHWVRKHLRSAGLMPPAKARGSRKPATATPISTPDRT